MRLNEMVSARPEMSDEEFKKLKMEIRKTMQYLEQLQDQHRQQTGRDYQAT